MPIDPACSLFLFAHPDDEFFCAGFLADEVRRGHAVHCVYLTDGAWGGQSVQRRIDESMRVLGRYGVDAARVHFIGASLGIPDGGLQEHMQRAYAALRDLFAAAPARIHTTAWEGGHQDHDVCHAIALRLAAEVDGDGAAVYQFPLYHAQGLAGPWFRVMSPLAGNGPVEARRLSLAELVGSLLNAFRYPSQWKTWLGLLPFAAWRLIGGRRMVRQPARVGRLAERPHAGPLLYEKRCYGRFEDVQRHILDFMGDIAADKPLD